MIPKIIHYCWLSSDPIPKSLQTCMSTWKKVLPEYEYMLWNFDRFSKSKSKWVSDAFDNKKYAFAADYIRLYALYNYGGIYLDMDVEVKKTFNPFLNLNNMICFQNEKDKNFEVAAFGCKKGAEWIKTCLDYFDTSHFASTNNKGETNFDLEVLPHRIKRLLIENEVEFAEVSSLHEAESLESRGIIPIFPYDYFSPKSYDNMKICETSNTVCIHHFNGTWKPLSVKYKEKIAKIAGPKIVKFLKMIKRMFTGNSSFGGLQ